MVAGPQMLERSASPCIGSQTLSRRNVQGPLAFGVSDGLLSNWRVLQILSLLQLFSERKVSQLTCQAAHAYGLDLSTWSV